MKKFIAILLLIVCAIMLVSGCGNDRILYYGKVTFNIHTHDGKVITIMGERHANEHSEDHIFKLLDNYYDFKRAPEYEKPIRKGYYFNGLYYTNENGERYCIFDGWNGIDEDVICSIKDDSVVDVYEDWGKYYYHFKFIAYDPTIENSPTYSCSFERQIGETILESDINFNHFKMEDYQERHGRYTYGGFEYSDGTNTYSWDFDRSLDLEFAEFIYDKFIKTIDDDNFLGNYENPVNVYIKWVPDNVNVIFNYGDLANPREQAVPFNSELNEYFNIDQTNVEFFGWYLDEDLQQLKPSELPDTNEVVELYASYKRFKSIKIDLRDGNGEQDARVYEDETISLQTPQDKILLGFSASKFSSARINNFHQNAEEGNTYYAVYVE